ncbi:MAG: hypothetical protein R2750_10045 [Bacteroidales bacterium]
MRIAISPLYKWREFESKAQQDSTFMAGFDTAWNHREFSDMVNERTYKQAMLKLAEKDSIQLAINLVDSSVNLFINGVKIHQSNVKMFEQNQLLKKLPVLTYAKIFSLPLAVNSQVSTIVKEPVVVRQAPKDPEEAMQNAWQPDTLIQYPAFLLLRLNYGIDLIFEQDQHPGFYEKWIKFGFYKEIWKERVIKAITGFFKGKKQEYYPAITLYLPADDIRVIYRALPQFAYTVIYY